MRYFIQTETAEKGPYDLASIQESIRAGRLPPEVRVRPENQDGWFPADELLAAPSLPARRPRRKASERPDDGVDTAVPPTSPVEGGSFLLGFVAGLLGGLVVVALVLRGGRPDTKHGAYVGFGLQVLVFCVVRYG